MIRFHMLAVTVLFGLTNLTPLCYSQECNDQGRIYRYCSDQGPIFEAAKTQAAAEGKLLLVTFGANWCPWCRSMNTTFQSQDFTREFGEIFRRTEIATSGARPRERVESGHVIVQALIQASGMEVKFEGIPFLAVLNPRTNKVQFINTANLEQNTQTSRGHDPAKVTEALRAAISEVR